MAQRLPAASPGWKHSSKNVKLIKQTAMIEYAKIVLPVVCAWKDLFRKELMKCMDWTEPEKRDELFNWCYEEYAGLHPDVLEEVFLNRIEKSIRFKCVTEVNWSESIVISHNADFTNTQKQRFKKIV